MIGLTKIQVKNQGFLDYRVEFSPPNSIFIMTTNT